MRAFCLGNQSQATLLLSTLGGGQVSNQLNTEIKILESPSVLMKTCEYVKKEKLAKEIDSIVIPKTAAAT